MPGSVRGERIGYDVLSMTRRDAGSVGCSAFALLLAAIALTGCPPPDPADGGVDVATQQDVTIRADVAADRADARLPWGPACPPAPPDPLTVTETDPVTGCPTLVERTHYWTAPCGDCDSQPICCNYPPSCTFTTRVIATYGPFPNCLGLAPQPRDYRDCHCVGGTILCDVARPSVGCLDCPMCFPPHDSGATD